MEETFHIDTVCHSGRPSDPRSAKETACYDLLDSLGIAYERVDHDAAMTMELCHAAEGVLHISICKNLFLCNRQKTKFYLLLMPGGKPFHTKDLSAQLGCARLSFGPPEDTERLALLPQDAVVVNVGRGSFLDADALARELQSGHLFGAGLDVTEPEPLPAEHPLWNLQNCILTPHVAGVSFGHLPQTEERIWRICAENLERYAAGDPLRNLVREIPL